jgi:tryptophanyl-tRNA synthetase
MDLTAPGEKMSKSSSSTAGALRLLDEPAILRRKVMRAVTDTGSEVVYDPQRKPGTSNLLATNDKPERLAPLFDRYGELKEAVADAVVTTLAPVQQHYVELARDPEHVRAVLRACAKRAREQTSEKVRQAKEAIGLLPA